MLMRKELGSRLDTTAGSGDMPRTAAALLAAGILALLGGCASLDQRRGSAGPISWEIVWNGPSGPGEPRTGPDARRRYAIVLRETAGRRIEFDWVDSLAEFVCLTVETTREQTPRFGTATTRAAPARRYLGETIDAGGERRIAFEFPLSVCAIEIVHQFHGRIEGSRLVRVDVKVRMPRR
jgi:hypothetical protein